MILLKFKIFPFYYHVFLSDSVSVDSNFIVKRKNYGKYGRKTTEIALDIGR